MRNKLKNLDSEKLLRLVIIGIFFYIAFLVITYWVDQPVSPKGYIRDGHTVDFETEEKLSDYELKKAAKEEESEANAQTIQTLYYCLGVSKDIDNYDCLANILSNDAKHSYGETGENIGENLYNALIQDRTLTGIENEVIREKYEKSIYNVWFKFLDGTKENYQITVENGVITQLKGRS